RAPDRRGAALSHAPARGDLPLRCIPHRRAAAACAVDPQCVHRVGVAAACKIVALMQQADGKLLARVAAHFAESVKLKQQAAEVLGEPIAKAGRMLAESLKAGGKV